MRAAGFRLGVEIYKGYLKLARQITKLSEKAEIATYVSIASDWVYNTSTCAGPRFLLVGDAGCFADPDVLLAAIWLWQAVFLLL